MDGRARESRLHEIIKQVMQTLERAVGCTRQKP